MRLGGGTSEPYRGRLRGDVGESVAINLRYTLATSCWTTRTILTEPEPHQFVQTTTHEPRDGKCPQVPSPQETTLTIDADEPGDWSLTLILDGQQHLQRSFTVNPA